NTQRMLMFKDPDKIRLNFQDVQFMSEEESTLTRDLFGWYMVLIPKGFTPLLIPNSAINQLSKPSKLDTSLNSLESASLVRQVINANISEVNPKQVIQPSPVKIPRPPNAFMLFRKDVQKSVRQLYRALPNKEISIIIANMYANLSQEEKRTYVERAQNELEIHKQNYPQYKFTPKRGKPVKKLRKLKPKGANQMSELINCFDSLNDNFNEVSEIDASAIINNPNNGLSKIKNQLFKSPINSTSNESNSQPQIGNSGGASAKAKANYNVENFDSNFIGSMLSTLNDSNNFKDNLEDFASYDFFDGYEL
ncbi:hypothetical protein L0F63_005280, partial [Massospora cicadina]